MGICYSSTGSGSSSRRRSSTENEEVDDWWKEKDGSKTKKKKQKTSFDFKFKTSFSTGGGRGGSSEERALNQIPGRLLASGSTSIASLFTQQGKKGTNQDAMIFWENFSSRSDTVFCGVFDGHGPYGHMVSRKVRDALPVLLSSEWKAHSNADKSEDGHSSTKSKNVEETIDENWSGPLEVEDSEKLPATYLPLKQSILEAFKLMDKELKSHSVIDCFCSGTTAVTLVKQGHHIAIGNVGDSRAVLATRDKDNGLNAIQLTVDLKPNLPREAARIQQCKGRVFALQDEPEVARVWLPNSDSPGLAMARAFGDFCLKDFGLISVPDVYYRQLTERDEFIILASDGVWDVLSNKEAVDIIASAPSRATAARALVDCATRGWRLKYPTSKIDDCAVVCLFLEPPQPPAGAEEETVKATHQEPETRVPATTPESRISSDIEEVPASVIEHSIHKGSTDEIVPVLESTEEKLTDSSTLGQSKRSLAECLSTAEEEEWSALEGITRVNSLLSLPRFLSIDKGSATSWKKWLSNT